MIRHESIYDKEKLKEISFKEFYADELQQHEEYKQNGKHSVKKYKNNKLIYHREYDKLGRTILELRIHGFGYIEEPSYKDIEYKNPFLDKHYYRYNFTAYQKIIVDFEPPNGIRTYFRNGLELRLILYKHIDELRYYKITKYLDKQ